MVVEAARTAMNSKDSRCYRRDPVKASTRAERDAWHRPVDGRNENYLLAEPHLWTRPEPTSAPTSTEGRPGNLSPPVAASLGDGKLGHLESRPSSVAFDAF
jgi:hypothetical protein